MFEDPEGLFQLSNDEGLKVPILTNSKVWRVSIYETIEPAPISLSYTFLCMIPSIREDNGAATFRNLLKGLKKIVKVEGRKLLEESYENDSKHFATNPNLTLVYKGGVNGEGAAAEDFSGIQFIVPIKDDE